MKLWEGQPNPKGGTATRFNDAKAPIAETCRPTAAANISLGEREFFPSTMSVAHLEGTIETNALDVALGRCHCDLPPPQYATPRTPKTMLEVGAAFRCREVVHISSKTKKCGSSH